MNFWLIGFLAWMVYSSAYAMATAEPEDFWPLLLIFGLIWGSMFGAGILTELW